MWLRLFIEILGYRDGKVGFIENSACIRYEWWCDVIIGSFNKTKIRTKIYINNTWNWNCKENSHKIFSMSFLVMNGWWEFKVGRQK